MRRSGGGDRGSGLPLKTHKEVGFLSNTGPDPLKITKLPSQHSMLGHNRHASETPLNGALLASRWWPVYSGIWILPPLINLKTKTQKKQGQSWTPSDKTFWIRACSRWLTLCLQCCLLIAFANSLGPDQAWQNVRPDLDPNCFNTLMVFPKRIFWKSWFWKTSAEDKNA